MKRDQIKAVVQAYAAADTAWGETVYEPYWRSVATHPSNMTKAEWQSLYDQIPRDAAHAVAQASAPESTPEHQEAPAPVTDSAPEPVGLDAALDGLGMVLSEKALTPLRAGIEALKRDAAQAVAHAKANAVTAAPVKAGTHVASLVKTAKLNTLIGGRGELAKSVDVDVYDHPDTPTRNSNFVWPKCTPEVFAATRLGHNVCLFGDRGTGKSSFVREFAAVTRRPHFEISFHEEMSSYELWGQRGIAADGSTDRWDAGVLLVAITTPHAVIDLSEMTVSRPGLVMSLNAPLERGSRSILLDGVLHKVHPTVTFFATSNDNGSGEAADRFQGVRPMNAATRSRFVWIPVDLPDRRELARMIAKAANLPRPAADMLAAYEVDVRAQVAKAECEATPGMRALVAWGELAMAGVSSASAFDMAARHTGTSEDGAVWGQRVDAMFDHDAFERAARGQAAPAAPAAPEQETPETTGRTLHGFSEI